MTTLQIHIDNGKDFDFIVQPIPSMEFGAIWKRDLLKNGVWNRDGQHFDGHEIQWITMHDEFSTPHITLHWRAGDRIQPRAVKAAHQP